MAPRGEKLYGKLDGGEVKPFLLPLQMEDSRGTRTGGVPSDVYPSYSSAVESTFLPDTSVTSVRSKADGKDVEETYDLAEYGYGKNYVKVLKVRREGDVHHIREYEVNTHLQLDSREDFLQGVNKHIIATDTQKNTVYVLAKKFGVSWPFGSV